MKDNVFQIKNLPCDIAMEQYLLGCMLIHDGQFVPKILFSLYLEDYFQERNRIIASAIFDLHLISKTPVNVYSVLKYLADNKLTQKVPTTYVMGLTTSIITTAYIDQAINRVRECAQRRQLLQAAEKLAQGALKGDPSTTLMLNTNAEFSTIARRGSTDGLLDVSDYITKNLRDDLAELALFSDRKTGFSNLDAAMGYKFPPGLYILGATPAIGKTTFAWQLLEQLAETHQHCIFVSYEMDKPRLVTKTLARRAFLINLREFTPSAAAIRFVLSLCCVIHIF